MSVFPAEAANIPLQMARTSVQHLAKQTEDAIGQIQACKNLKELQPLVED